MFHVTELLSQQQLVRCRYWQLRSGNPNWWWRSFAQGAFLAIPLCPLGVMQAVLHAGSASHLLLVFCYTVVAGAAVAVAFGAVSMASSLVFVWWVYSSAPVDANVHSEAMEVSGGCTVIDSA